MAENTFTMRTLWRLIAWGGCAAIAVTGFVLVGETEVGANRIHVALNAAKDDPAKAVVLLPSPTAAPDRRTIELESETKRLTETVRVLASDRDRLAARLASIENNLADMTGSIKDMASTIKKETRAVAAAPMPVPTPAPPSPPPVIAAPATAPAPVPAASLPKQFPPAQLSAAPAAFPPAPEAPTHTASIAPEAKATTEPPKPKPGIGIEIAGAGNVETLRTQWAALKANHGPLFAGLQPYVTTQTNHAGAQEVRLVLGPLPNSAAAGRVCAMLAAARIPCRPATYDGQRLTQQ